MDFHLTKQDKESETGSPVFVFQVMLEGVAGESGRGFSKKEAQQQASEATLKRLKREPQFIDAIFAAKSDRTKMEEMPTVSVPDTAKDQEFIIAQEKEEESLADADSTEKPQSRRRRKPSMAEEAQAEMVEFDLSDITHNEQEKSREDIIAEAEAQAFAE